MSSTVLNAAKALITPSYARTYVMPGERADVVDTIPFVTLEELTDFPNRTAQIDYIGAQFQREWRMAIYVHAYAQGEYPPTSSDNMLARAATFTARDAIIQLLLADPTIGGTLDGFDFQGETLPTIEYEDIVGYLEWDERPYFGCLILVPIKETIYE